MPPAISSTADLNSTVYINGCVYTIDSARPWASAFIVSADGLFEYVGSTEEVLLIAQRRHLVIVDLKNQFVMPGVHDAHMHFLYSGLALTSDVDIGMDTTATNIAQKIKDAGCKCHYVNTYQDWIMANVYNNEGFPNGVADRKDLDEMFPDIPVVVSGGAGHSKLLNTKALERAGYDIENEKDVHGGKFFRREDGSLTGELGETAMTKAALALPFPGLNHIKRVLKYAIVVAHRSGVTSCQEASSNTLLLRALKELDEEGKLDLDISTHIVYGPEYIAHESASTLHKLLDETEKFKSKHVDTRFVKIILDGVPLPPLYTHCGLDDHGVPDKSKIVVEDVKEAICKYDERGMTVRVHCTGHGSTRTALDGIEMARKKNPDGPRHEIAHCSGVHDDDFSRYAPLRVTAEMSPAEFFSHPFTASSNGLIDWDFTKILDADALVTIGSDWGAIPDPCLFDPLSRIVEAVGRGSKEKGAEILCRMLTLNGADAVGKEKEAGSVEIGKKANFIVVDRDLSEGLFEGARVVRTYFEGECVWDREY
ncbi:amidohydrolase 3 [Massariosphaeria phaeospora]|uniref:Amidohydrolase 3 n=1 Tax=Massariosphaeria phaeospora TaxID=100035 RepID=A0A7C8MKR8_9PLEO|nr:amidohydrolase 3 [Massariosphaeria phaeospora]